MTKLLAVVAFALCVCSHVHADDKQQTLAFDEALITMVSVVLVDGQFVEPGKLDTALKQHCSYLRKYESKTDTVRMTVICETATSASATSVACAEGDTDQSVMEVGEKKAKARLDDASTFKIVRFGLRCSRAE